MTAAMPDRRGGARPPPRRRDELRDLRDEVAKLKALKLTFAEIGRRLGLTKGVVMGIDYRTPRPPRGGGL